MAGVNIGHYYGASFSELPPGLQDQIVSCTNYRAWGFGNPGDLIDHIRHRTLETSSGTLSLSLVALSNGLEVGVGLP